MQTKRFQISIMKMAMSRVILFVIFLMTIFVFINLAIININFIDKFSFLKEINIVTTLEPLMNEDVDFNIGRELFFASNETVYNKCLKTFNSRTESFTTWKIKPKPCDNRVTILLLIKSSIMRNSLRKTLRSTWAQEITTRFGNVKRIFVVGSAPANQSVALIEKENVNYKDILQGSFEDTYKSVTSKVLMGVHFIKIHCAHVDRIIVADDDAMLLPWNFFTNINLNNSGEKFFAGFTVEGAIPRRDRKDRWYVAPEAYNCTHYPLYPSGTAYVFSQRTLVLFHYLSRVIQMFAWEDVYFGILAKIGNVSITRLQDSRFSYSCVEMFRSHSIESISNLLACHGTDEVSDHMKVWSELCYSPTSNLETKQLLLKYCSQ